MVVVGQQDTTGSMALTYGECIRRSAEVGRDSGCQNCWAGGSEGAAPAAPGSFTAWTCAGILSREASSSVLSATGRQE